jgi:hypothetical protein
VRGLTPERRLEKIAAIIDNAQGWADKANARPSPYGTVMRADHYIGGKEIEKIRKLAKGVPLSRKEPPR